MSVVSPSPSRLEPRALTPTTVDYDVRRGSEGGKSKALLENFRDPFSETEREIYGLLTRPEGWDGYEAPRPNPASVVHARSWAEHLYRDVRTELWLKPHVSSDEDGDVSFEWWKGQRKITVYVSPEDVGYIKVKKADSSLEMEDGSIESDKELRALWNWLIS